MNDGWSRDFLPGVIVLFKFVLLGLVLGLTGCANRVPPPTVHQPMTAKPVVNETVVPADGAIFHAGINERPLFEDRRARNVGDILTINIVEKTSVSRASSADSSYSNSVNANIPTITSNIPDKIGGPIGSLLGQLFSLTGSVAGESTNETANDAKGSGSQNFTGTITVSVINVLPNGYLLVSGERQLTLNNSGEFIRFSGVVNPATITGANAVQSTLVADARLEYRGAGAMNEFINDSRTLGFLGRFFLSVLPF